MDYGLLTAAPAGFSKTERTYGASSANPAMPHSGAEEPAHPWVTGSSHCANKAANNPASGFQ